MTVQSKVIEFECGVIEDQSLLLKRLSLQIAQMSSQISEITKRSFLAPVSASPTAEPKADNDLLSCAKRLYFERRRRRAYFNEALLGEPAWDILLDVFIHNLSERKVSITSACIGSGVPSTTALRWIALLEGQGLLFREEDPQDRRRAHVHLTPKGTEAMTRYLLEHGAMPEVSATAA